MRTLSTGRADVEILAAVADGDRRALRVLYDRHAPWLALRLARRCADPGVVDETLQDGLTLASLALTTRMRAPVACASLAVARLLGVWPAWGLAREPLLVFGWAGQVACPLVAAIAVLVLVRNADSFERRGDVT
jgi:hypothetical protein